MCFSNTQSKVMDHGDNPGLPKVPKVPKVPSVPNVPKVITVPNDSNLPNIMVLGPTGGGVSSVVNLIAGEDIARVSNDIPRCTTEMAAYPIELINQGEVIRITLYDIPGFDHDVNSPLEFPCVDISLAIICMEDRSAHVTATMKYLRDMWKKHGSGNVPVLVVINHMAPTPDADWWENNKEHFANFHAVADHVCLTRPHLSREKQETTKRLHSLIIQHLSSRNVGSRTRAS